jgi:hypothetical protein
MVLMEARLFSALSTFGFLPSIALELAQPIFGKGHTLAPSF